MLSVKPYKQSRGYCGPTSLRIILEYYGIKQSEKDLAYLCKAHPERGCSEYHIINAARKFGFRGYVKQSSSLIEVKSLIKKGIPVIVDWFSPQEGGHYSVVVGFEKEDIILADPHFGKLMHYDTDWFEERWFDMPFRRKGPILKEIIVIRK